jgi:hypothetical protein
MGKNFGIAANLFKSLSSNTDEFIVDAPEPLPAIGPELTTVIFG